jgi:hypothetical protein
VSGQSPEMLFARLQLQAPSARSILLAPPRSERGVDQLAASLAGTIVAAGGKARLLAATTTEPKNVPAAVERMQVLETELVELERARRALGWPIGFTIAYAGGVLDTPAALVLAAAVDAVVLVARAGHTMRADLVQAKSDIEVSGGIVVGSVLLG